MNDLIHPLLWLVLQITLLALATLILSASVMRRAPATAARLTTLALLGCAVLTVLAFCPLPNAWNWNSSRTVTVTETPASPTTDGERTDAVSSQRIESPNTETAPNWNFARTASRLLPHLRETAKPAFQADEHRFSWPLVVFLGGATIGLLRLLCGIWAVERCRRRSVPIADLELRQLRDELCGAIGVSPAMELRESPDLTTPATIGWWRPAILLPADWRTWSADDLRAVLAHELAHVQRRDYVAWLLARFVLALHFYHPLLYWLAARLRLQQELAADALGAEHAGGAANYLRALARMALRQDGRRDAAPTLAFLSSPGTLLRRIAMLRTTDGRPYRLLPCGVRVAGFLLLLAVALGVSALRAPAEKPLAPAAPKEPASETPSVEPFELSYLAADTNGVLAFRPAAVLGRPEMKAQLEQINTAMAAIQNQMNPDVKALVFKLEDLDQVVCSGLIKTDKSRKEGQSMLLFHTLVMRSVHDFDWKKAIAALVGELKTVEIEGQTCYQPAKAESAKMYVFLPLDSSAWGSFCFFIPDKRTVVIDSKDAMSAILRARGQKKPVPAWQADWKHVERGLAAFAFADASVLNERSEPDEKTAKELRTVIGNSTSIVLGLDYRDGPTCQAIFRSAKETAAEKNVAQLKDLMTVGHNAHRKADWKGKETVRDLYKEWLDNHEVRREGTTVQLRSSAKTDFADLMRALMDGNLGL